jgi:hypothetical protein
VEFKTSTEHFASSAWPSETSQWMVAIHVLAPTNDYGWRKMAWTPPAYAGRCVSARRDKELVCASLAAAP